MRRFKLLTLTLALSLLSTGSFGFASAAALSGPSTFGAAGVLKQDACGGLNQVDTGVQSDCGNLAKQGSGVEGIVGSIVNILSWVIGVLAVIMVMVAGFRYITSGGDSNAVSGAKNTLIYALVGLVIAALAQVLVHFALSTASK